MPRTSVTAHSLLAAVGVTQRFWRRKSVNRLKVQPLGELRRLSPRQERTLEGLAMLLHRNQLKLSADDVALAFYMACMNRG